MPVNQKPTQKVLWPNVSLSSLPRFETSLDKWFGRKNIPVWITEYGHETKPGEPAGITEAQQALYVTQAIDLAKKDPRVPMFVWFVMRDSIGSLWQSGIYRLAGAAKPARPRFAAAAKPLSPVNGKVTVKGGTKNPTVKVYLRSFCVNSPIGAKVGLTSRTTLGGKQVAYSQPQLQARDRLHRVVPRVPGSPSRRARPIRSRSRRTPRTATCSRVPSRSSAPDGGRRRGSPGGAALPGELPAQSLTWGVRDVRPGTPHSTMIAVVRRLTTMLPGLTL